MKANWLFNNTKHYLAKIQILIFDQTFSRNYYKMFIVNIKLPTLKKKPKKKNPNKFTWDYKSSVNFSKPSPDFCRLIFILMLMLYFKKELFFLILLKYEEKKTLAS